MYGHALFFPGYVCELKLLGTLDSIIYLPSSFIRAWDWQLKICFKKKVNFFF